MNLSSRLIDASLLLPAGSEVFFSDVVTDSRKIVPGSLFVALLGDHFDGHQFIEKAIEQSARGVVCARAFPGPRKAGVRYFEVDDTEIAFRSIAHAWRKQFKIPVFGVAGSFGKTTTKELLHSMLEGHFGKVLKTEGSQNGFVGIPMTLLKLRPEHRAAVIEIGIDEVGAMRPHLELVEPTAVTLTGIGPEHLDKLIDLETVAREESIALSFVAERGGTVAIALDDPWIEKMVKALGTTRAKLVPYSLQGKTLGSLDSLQGTLSREDPQGLEINGLGIKGEVFRVPLPGKHNAANFLAAFALARSAGMAPLSIHKGLHGFKGATGRSEIQAMTHIFHGRPHTVHVINDSYNAQPASMQAGLEMLSELSDQHSSRKIACLADMLELGTLEETLHRQIAPLLQAHHLDEVFLYGPRMKWLFDELTKVGAKFHFQHFATHAELSECLLQILKPGDCVLIKGSRGMKMEKIWQSLRENASP